MEGNFGEYGETNIIRQYFTQPDHFALYSKLILYILKINTSRGAVDAAENLQ